jgi:serine/threonine-protein kinase
VKEPIAKLRPDIPPGLEEVIARCLQITVEDRIQNAADLALALAPFGDAQALPSAQRVAHLTQAPKYPTEVNTLASDDLDPSERRAFESALQKALQPATNDPPPPEPLSQEVDSLGSIENSAFGTPETPSRRRSPKDLALTVAGAAAVFLMALWELGPTPSTTSHPTATASRPPQGSAPGPLASAPRPLEPAGSVKTTAAPLPRASGAPVPMPSSPSAPPSASPKPTPSSQPRAASGPSRPIGPAPSVPPLTWAPGPAAPATPACNPSYWVDEHGYKRFKPECFRK